MKQDIHQKTREVCFLDIATGTKFIYTSCVNTKESVNIDGVDFPLYKLEVSSASHPFYIGTQKHIDTSGLRVKNFKKKWGNFLDVDENEEDAKKLKAELAEKLKK